MSRAIPPPPRGPFPPPSPRATNSLADTLVAVDHAYDTAMRSKRARPAMVWLVGALLSAASGGIGWIASKVDTQHDMQAIRGDLQAIRAGQDAQARAVQDLVGDNPPGRLLRLERGQRYVWRAVLEARTGAVAGESDKVRAIKAAEAARLGAAFDRRLEDPRKAPMDAYDEIAERVAVK